MIVVVGQGIGGLFRTGVSEVSDCRLPLLNFLDAQPTALRSHLNNDRLLRRSSSAIAPWGP